ncbi:MAG: type VI secretion system ATPase TssH [Gammaproteobacteria bacterium]|jgi:type VI secretion system protein VasG|nr:type VI secretion system ATPase TssH [Gammaproteobacteria bacterium]MBT3725820.1 type VI secretion system ATPase TssH [Gammaproteobacteria bacterium]MBT4193354.1 type VI secretion system ATPase TssH [Gammaproteobacteria bacterium]MBT4448238.1 type VI secretion system ATPase TssH [Gammaproteobacteria bacterium]MBT4860442.1 type VI secretion system ATPase TssH [Gammaproteobacteria bacterium]
MRVNLKGLVSRLNPFCTKSLEAASGLCVTRSHYEVAVEHMLLQLLDESEADAQLLLRHFEIDPVQWAQQIQQELETFKNANPGKPVFAENLLNWLEESWIISSVQLSQSDVRSAALIAALADNPLRYGVSYLKDIERITLDEIIKQFDSLQEVSREKAVAGKTMAGSAAPSGASALSQYTTNFTEKARNNEVDPVFGRDREIRQMIDILGRRRKNNPIAVGDAGVGKTAVIEGLALKVVEGDVPDIIKNVDIVELDLGLLQAGASVKGEFENRLTAVINEIKSSEKPIILFIDEAHTLIGAGGSAGTGDAANLLKPALARGELKTIAATTWSEYKKYFEKDPALARRFQLVKLDEPSVENTSVILRGLRPVYENAHKVYIRDDAIETASALSARYITGRQLPDKAVDVLDTACSRVNISLTTKPAEIEDLERETQIKTREMKALQRDVESGRSSKNERLEELIKDIESNNEEIELKIEEWKKQKKLVDKVIELRAGSETEPTDEKQGELSTAIQELEEFQQDKPQIAYEVTTEVVADVVSDWTGVPVGNIVKDEAENLLSFNAKLKNWVKGQDHAIEIIDSIIRTAKAGLQNPDQPHGVFLFVGPSGVGKTEMALGVANLMFGGEQFVTTINMSEYQEKHTVSRLVGSPAGYVGYGEGGVLTEAVRQRPYSVVLLDEVEKADLEVMNLFYQVFDKGMLSDGEGRLIDFKNTIIFLTSNLASATIMEMCEGDEMPSMDELNEAIRVQLQNHFKPALLARMTVIPFFPLQGEVLNSIVKIKLDKVGKRLKQNQALEFDFDEKVIEQIASRCTDIESGARNIDHIVNKTLLPLISTKILNKIGDETEYSNLILRISQDGEFEVELS